MQTANGGFGLYLSDVRGFSSFADDIEGTTTANGVTAVLVATTTRDNNMYGPWIEANTNGLVCQTGFNRFGMFGGTITSNGTDIDPNCIGLSTLLNINVTGKTLNTIGTRLGVATSTSYNAALTPNVFGVTGASLFNGNLTLDNGVLNQINSTGTSTLSGNLDLAALDIGTIHGVLQGENGYVTPTSTISSNFLDSAVITLSEIDTVGEIQTIVGGQNILLETEIDGCSELAALLDGETGTCDSTNGPVFPILPTLVGFLSTASSTIGNGTNSGGLTVFGGATTSQATTTQLFASLASTTQAFIFTANVTNLLAISSMGTIDFGAAASFEIPNSTAPVVDAIGEIALDTTDNQLLVGTSTNASFPAVIPLEQPLFSFTTGSTSVAFESGGLMPIDKWVTEGREITRFSCHVQGGTSKVVNVTDGSNDTESITCATTETEDTSVDTNSTFSADELWKLEYGATTGVVDYVSFTAYGFITRE